MQAPPRQTAPQPCADVDPFPGLLMIQLDEVLSRLRSHEGVEQVLLVGSDGLLVRHLGQGGGADPETLAAMVPGLATASSTLGRAVGRGTFSTAVVELSEGVIIVVALSPDLLAAAVVRPGVGFAPLLRELRGERSRLAALL